MCVPADRMVRRIFMPAQSPADGIQIGLLYFDANSFTHTEGAASGHTSQFAFSPHRRSAHL